MMKGRKEGCGDDCVYMVVSASVVCEKFFVAGWICLAAAALLTFLDNTYERKGKDIVA